MHRKSERKRPLGRPKHTCEDNIEINIKGVGWKYCELDNLTQDRGQ